MEHDHDQEIEKTLESFVPSDSTLIDSGYGGSDYRDGPSSELGEVLDEKLSLDQTAIVDQNNQMEAQNRMGELIRDTIVPAFTIDADGDTWLHIFLAQTSLQDAQKLIYYCPDSRLLDIRNKLGLSALHISVLMNLEEEVKMLICKNARMDAVDNEGNNILHMCAEKGHSRSLSSILQICEQRGTMDQVLSLSERTNYKGWTPFFTAAVNKHRDVCRLFVLKVNGINVNAGDLKSGNSPLHEAVMARNNIEFIYFLLQDCHADVNFKNRQSVVPLHIAATIEDEAICAILLKYNALCTIRDDNGNTPAAYAANERILQYLKT